MVFIAPWVKHKNKQLFTNMIIKQTILLCNTKTFKGLTQLDLAPLRPTIKKNVHKHKNVTNNLMM